MQIGFWQIAIVVLLVVLLFGRGKISDLMGDVAKGITNFKKGIADGDDKKPADGTTATAAATDPKTIQATAETVAAAPAAAAAASSTVASQAKPAEGEKKAG